MRALFIVGVPRSGTTVLQAILNRGDDIALMPETHFYTGGFHLIENPSEQVFNWLRSPEGAAFQVNHESLLTEVTSSSARFLCSLSNVYLSNEQRNKLSYWGEKTPGHYEYLTKIWEDFPQARVIWVVRDPRAVAASYKSVPWYKGDSVVGIALRWRKALLRLSKVSEDSRLKIVRYEDLIRELPTVLRELAGFLEVDGVETYGELTSKSFDYDMQGNWQHKHLARASATIDERSLSRWTESLTENDLSVVRVLCGRLGGQFGYDLGVSVGRDRLRALTAFIQFMLRRPSIVFRKVRVLFGMADGSN